MTARRSDEAAMTAVRDGDVEALGELFERHHRRFYGFLLGLLGDEGRAEDGVQEVFLRLARYRRSYRPGAPFLPWALQVARRVAWAPHRPPETGLDETAAAATGRLTVVPEPERELTQAARRSQLVDALGRLPEATRELLLLGYFRELGHREIGELLGVKPGTVKVRLHRAVAALRWLMRTSESEA